jgi:hypothetical protein
MGSGSRKLNHFLPVLARQALEKETALLVFLMKAVRDQNDGCRAAKMAMLRTLPDTALREGIFAHPILAQLRSNLFLKVQPGKMVYRVCSCVSETEEGR